MRAPGVAAIVVAATAAVGCGRIGFDANGAVADDEPPQSQAYIKASNTEADDEFCVVALSGDGSTLAVGAYSEKSNATGIDGVQSDNSVPNAGAVYVFVRSGASWVQQAYIKASNTGIGLDVGDSFGWTLALSHDGSILAVGAPLEDSLTDPSMDVSSATGAVYIFTRAGGVWTQTALLKASNPDQSDSFGDDLALSGDGATLAVAAPLEASAATGVNGIEGDNTAQDSGAVYVYVRTGSTWAKQAYVKASNTEGGDGFGEGVSVSADGNTLAIGAIGESSGSQTDQADNSVSYAGAVYVFARTGETWSQTAYLKAGVPGDSDLFGARTALSASGDLLAVSAIFEGSAATGIGGDEANDAATAAGAVYTFVRVDGAWTRQAYIKAPNTAMDDTFGGGLALAADGQTLAVGAASEDSAATGFDGDMFDRSATSAGALYLLRRTTDGGSWEHVVYAKASNAYAGHRFGSSAALSTDGSVLAVGAQVEDSAATGVDGNQADHSAPGAGAAYVYW